jgi:hypothetical protein
VGLTAWAYERFGENTLQASARPSGPDVVLPPAAGARELPPDTPATVVAGSYPAGAGPDDAAASLTKWLEASGYRVYYASVDLGPAGHWQRVLAGTYTDQESAAAEAERLNRAAPGLEAQAMSAAAATGTDR